MNLQFVRQAIYQQKESGADDEKPLAPADRETWEPSAVIPASATKATKTSEPPPGKNFPAALHALGDVSDLTEMNSATSLLTAGGIDFRISPLVDSRESRLEERKALEEFHGLQNEARVVIVPETVMVKDRKSSPPPKRARASVTIVKPQSPPTKTTEPDKANLLSAYSSDSEDL